MPSSDKSVFSSLFEMPAPMKWGSRMLGNWPRCKCCDHWHMPAARVLMHGMMMEVLHLFRFLIRMQVPIQNEICSWGASFMRLRIRPKSTHEFSTLKSSCSKTVLSDFQSLWQGPTWLGGLVYLLITMSQIQVLRTASKFQLDQPSQAPFQLKIERRVRFLRLCPDMRMDLRFVSGKWEVEIWRCKNSNMIHCETITNWSVKCSFKSSLTCHTKALVLGLPAVFLQVNLSV